MDSSSDHVSVMSSSSDHMSLMGTSSDHASVMGTSSNHTSLMNVLSDVPIATPVAVESGSNYAPSDASSVVEHHSEALSALQQRESRPNVKGCEGKASTAHVSKPNAVENGELRYISKYLVQFFPDAKSQKKEEVV